MYKNLGVIDRLLRFILMDFVLGYSLAGLELSDFWADACLLFSIYLILTILAAYSPIYYLFDWNTRIYESPIETPQ